MLLYNICVNDSLLKYKLLIAYDGTQYGGWQVQLNAISIQALIEKALKTALRQEISIVASGRTDAGVHALAQIAHFDTTGKIPKDLCWATRSLLPPAQPRGNCPATPPSLVS